MTDNVIKTKLPGLRLIEPAVFKDSRGYFLEIFNQSNHSYESFGSIFVQDSLSMSKRGVLRGLHFQHPKGQGKLVQVLRGEVYDVAVDLRRGSPTFKKWYGTNLSDLNHRQLFIPEGFAHGFAVLSPSALFFYKCSDYYAPEYEHGINFADPELAIDWPVQSPILSDKDASLPMLKDIPNEHLPEFRVP